jgi:hypothetical protein
MSESHPGSSALYIRRRSGTQEKRVLSPATVKIVSRAEAAQPFTRWRGKPLNSWFEYCPTPQRGQIEGFLRRTEEEPRGPQTPL